MAFAFFLYPVGFVDNREELGSFHKAEAGVTLYCIHLLETYRIDGFRFDFTKGFTQKKTSGDSDLMVTDPERVAVLKEYYNAVKAVNSDAIVVMEHFCADEERTLAADGICFWRNMNGAYCQSAMGWKDKCDFSGLYDSVYPDKFVGYMESHDEERCAYKQIAFGNGVLKATSNNG